MIDPLSTSSVARILYGIDMQFVANCRYRKKVAYGMLMFGIGPSGPSREYINLVSSVGAVRVVEIHSLTLLAVDFLHSTIWN